LARSAGEALATPDNASIMKVPTLAVSAQNSNLRRFGVFQHNLPTAVFLRDTVTRSLQFNAAAFAVMHGEKS
jgi:hypothetical protein